MANPFATAPPPQTMAQGNVQIEYDDDDILMDYDDEPQQAHTTMNGNGTGDQMMEVEATAELLGDEQLAPEKVYLKGVDSMSTSNVKAFVAEHFNDVEVAKVEWIDDSSCCLVYRSPGEATNALNALQLVTQSLPPLALRPAKLAASHPDSRLEVRIARQDDRKVRGARDRSRYYLFNPEEDRVEQAARLRREREETRRLDRRRYTDGVDGDTREYERRYYDSREHDRRRNGTSTETYGDSFYDDDTASRNSRNSRNRHSSSRDRSYSPDRERARRQRSPIELFPERRNKGPPEVYPERRRESNRERELFPERAIRGGGSGREVDRYQPGRLKNEPIELFPRKPAASSRFIPSRSASPDRRVELFPQGVGPSRDIGRPTALADRITMPGRSLEERINLDRSGGNSGSERENVGYKIKGRGGDPGNDLFAQKLRAAKGENLVMEEGGGRRRGGARRNRAEDMFG